MIYVIVVFVLILSFGFSFYLVRKFSRLELWLRERVFFRQLTVFFSRSDHQKDEKSEFMVKNLTQNFLSGIHRLKKRGKDFYSDPWYLMVGEAGSGKTEAIRRSHCIEDFAEDFADYRQGIGGTINMNWWFTKKGIIIDTAGRIFDGMSGTSDHKEWIAFLRLLVKFRPKQPVNGVILSLSAEDLIHSDNEILAKKSSIIKEQLKEIREVLSVRYPVFIIITKCDLIPGFKDFFSKVEGDAALQQMIGWSNEEDLDVAFNSQELENAFEWFIQDIHRLRCKFMSSVVKGAVKNRKSMSEMFLLPHQLEGLIPKIRTYIDTVFPFNQDDKNRLFFRGIYFTSALQKGIAVDSDWLAAQSALTGVREAYGKTTISERAYFLRDLFFEKIYKEKRLVTAASHIGRHRLRLKLRFALLLIASILVGISYSQYSIENYNRAIGREANLWSFIELPEHYTRMDDFSEWNPSVIRKDGGQFLSLQNQTVFKEGRENYSFSQFILRINKLDSPNVEFKRLWKAKYSIEEYEADSNAISHAIVKGAIFQPLLNSVVKVLSERNSILWDENDAMIAFEVFELTQMKEMTMESDLKRKLEIYDNIHFYLSKEFFDKNMVEVIREVFSESPLVDLDVIESIKMKSFDQDNFIVKAIDYRFGEFASELDTTEAFLGNLRRFSNTESEFREELTRLIEHIIHQPSEVALDARLFLGASKAFKQMTECLALVSVRDETPIGSYHHIMNESRDLVDSFVASLYGEINKRTDRQDLLGRLFWENLGTYISRKELEQRYRIFSLEPGMLKQIEAFSVIAGEQVIGFERFFEKFSRVFNELNEDSLSISFSAGDMHSHIELIDAGHLSMLQEFENVLANLKLEQKYLLLSSIDKRLEMKMAELAELHFLKSWKHVKARVGYPIINSKKELAFLDCVDIANFTQMLLSDINYAEDRFSGFASFSPFIGAFREKLVGLNEAAQVVKEFHEDLPVAGIYLMASRETQNMLRDVLGLSNLYVFNTWLNWRWRLISLNGFEWVRTQQVGDCLLGELPVYGNQIAFDLRAVVGDDSVEGVPLGEGDYSVLRLLQMEKSSKVKYLEKLEKNTYRALLSLSLDQQRDYLGIYIRTNRDIAFQSLPVNYLDIDAPLRRQNESLVSFSGG